MLDTDNTLSPVAEMPPRAPSPPPIPLNADDEDELRVAACEPDLDPSFVELAVQLERGLAQRLEQAPADGRLERDREQLGRAGGRLVADRRDAGEVFAERLDVAVNLHDGSMTSQ